MIFDRDNTRNYMQAVPVMVMILVILVLIYTLVLYNNEIESAKQDFIEIGLHLTGQSAQGMELWIEDQITMAQIIADHPTIKALLQHPDQRINRYEARVLLEDLHKRYKYYEAIPIALFTEDPVRVANRQEVVEIENGMFVSDSVKGNLVGKGGMDLSYINEIYKGKPYYISEIYSSINSGEPIIAISAPVLFNDDLLGAAVVAPKIDYFSSRFVQEAKYGKTGYMLIVDGRGLTVAHPDEKHIMRPYEEQGKSEKNIINTILSGQTYFQGVYNDTNKSYYVKRVVLNSDHQPFEWYMVFTMENSEIYGNADKLLQISISLLIGGALLIGTILYYYTKSIDEKVKEIQALEMNRKLEIEVAARTSHLAEMAIRDGLTKLYNHDATYKAIGVAVASARASLQPLSIIMLDLDYFKTLNDTYGHPFGDKVLKATAEVLKGSVRSTDIVGRYGGEEFMIILPGAFKQSAIKTAKRIEKGLSELTFEHQVTITASMGVAAWVGEETDELISTADKLLYQAKRKGRNRIESTLSSSSMKDGDGT